MQNCSTNNDCVRGGEFSFHQSTIMEESSNDLSQQLPPSNIDAAFYNMTAKSEMTAYNQHTTEKPNSISVGSVSYSCDYCHIIHNINNNSSKSSNKKRIKMSFETLDLKEWHVIKNHPGWTAYPGPPDLEKFEQEHKKTQQQSVSG